MLAISVFFSLIMVGFGIPFAKRRIGPNQWSGIRVPETLNNPDIWYEANAYSGRVMILIGAVVSVVTVVLYLLPFVSAELYTGLVIAVVIVSSLVLVDRSLRCVQSLTPQGAEPEEPPLGIWAALKPGIIASLIAGAIMATISIFAWTSVPSDKMIPVHWGPGGPDNFAGKIHALVILPAAGLIGLSAFFASLTWFMARYRGTLEVRPLALVFWMLTLVLVLFGHIIITASAVYR